MIFENNYAMPSQRISRDRKNDLWREKCVDAILRQATVLDSGEGVRANSKSELLKNYDLVNSKFDPSDFDYVLNPYGSEGKWGEAPTKLQNYNIIRPKVEALKGEEMKLPMNFRAVAIMGDSVNEKLKAKNEAIMQSVIQNMLAYAEPQTDENGNPIQPETPEQVAKRFNTTYYNQTEKTANKLLKWLYHKEKLQMKFSQAWEHAIISAYEVYKLDIRNGHVTIDVVNPLGLAFDKGSDTTFIQEGDWAREERWVPVGSIIDEYGEYLTDEQVRKIEEGRVNTQDIHFNTVPGFAYDMNYGVRNTSSNQGSSSHVYVADVAWRSFKKIGFLSYVDPNTGEMEERMVDEDYKLSEDEMASGATISYEWTTEIWQGTKIGGDMYINIHPTELPGLPYIGYVYNNVNSQATSLVGFIKAHQYTYMITWWRLEQELAKAKGKKFVMDIAQMPKSQGWDIDQWMYYFDNLGVIWINSMEEGREGDPNSIAKFNQFQSIDVSLSNVVGQYLEILNKIEQQVVSITGISPQREGDIGQTETATGAQRAIIQSTNITKPMFAYHDLVKAEVLTYALELCKIAYADGIELQFMLDEVDVETLRVDKDALNGDELGVFISNSADTHEKLQELKSLANVAMQQDKANLSDIISILESNSISEIKSNIIASERDKVAQAQQAQQAQQEADAALKEAELAFEREKEDREDIRQDKELENKLQIAMLSRESGGADANAAYIAAEKARADIQQGKEKLELEKQKHKDTVALKKEDLNIKRVSAANKPTKQ